jgi:hypothetical protein
MQALKSLLFFFTFFLSITIIFAQQKPTVIKKGERKIAVAKFKPPKLKSFLGDFSDTLLQVSVDVAEKLVTLPIKITDTKNGKYTISSYYCMYTKKVVTEDEQTGKAIPTTSMTADLFRASPLPNIWQKNIIDELKVGEEIYFFDVVVTDQLGRVLFAPNIKIRVK